MTSPSVNGLTFLLVEDDPLNAALCHEQLMLAGAAQVIACSCVEEAMRKLSNLHFDAAVVDFRLRGETSTTVVARLDALGIPKVLVTGCIPDVVPDEYTEVLLKPYTRESLISAIAAACQKRTGSSGTSSPHRVFTGQKSQQPKSFYAANDDLDEAAE